MARAAEPHVLELADDDDHDDDDCDEDACGSPRRTLKAELSSLFSNVELKKKILIPLDAIWGPLQPGHPELYLRSAPELQKPGLGKRLGQEGDGGGDTSGTETSGSTSSSSGSSTGRPKSRDRGLTGWFRGWTSHRSSGSAWEAFPPVEQSRELHDIISQRDALNARIQELQFTGRGGLVQADLSSAPSRSLQFLDPAVERQWRTVGIRHNTRLGARVLTVFLLAMLMQTVLVCLQTSLECDSWLMGSFMSAGGAYRLGNHAVVLLILPALCHVVWRPRFSCYLVCVLVLFANSVLTGISPYKSYCDNLNAYPGTPMFCKGSYNACVNSLDNSQRVMSWILLCIWVVPEYRYMRYTWIFIWTNLVAVAVEMRWTTDQDSNPNPVDATKMNQLLVSAVFFVGVNMIAVKKKWYFEKRQRTRFLYALKHKEVSRKLYYILATTTPQYVVSQLIRRQGDGSVMFILIADFDKFANSRSGSPLQIMKYLNHYFCLLDSICELNGVTKIETVGEEYVCAVGVVPEDREISARAGHKLILGRLVRVAHDILDLQAASILRDDEAQQVAFKMGIHTGPVTAGIVGQRLPRFRLFGDTMNTAARMMQKASRGEVQFGVETRRELDPREVPIVPKGPVEMKGKGWLDVYVLGARPYPAHAHNDPSSVSSEDSDGGALAEERPRASTGTTESRTPRRFGTAGSSGSFRRRLGTLRAALEGVAAADRPLECVRCGTETPREHGPDTFDHVLQDLGGRSFQHGTWRFLGPGSEATPEEEQVFQEWFFHACVMNKLPQRLAKMAAVLVVLTATETVYVLFAMGVFGSLRDVAKGMLKMAIFLASRAVVLGVILIWRTLIHCNCSILTDVKWCQRYLVMSYCIVVSMIYISYDATPQLQSLNDSEEPAYTEHAVSSGSPLVLISFPVYVIVVTAHRLLFVHSLFLLALALVLMLLESVGPASVELDVFGSQVSVFSGIFLSVMGRLLFITYNLIPVLEAYVEESSLRHQHRAQRAIFEARRRMGGVLDTLMPPLVIKELKMRVDGGEQVVHWYHDATVVQSDLVGFTLLASSRPPSDVVCLIRELFGLFDALADEYAVYKVETVGDAYIAAQAEEPLSCKNSPLDVVTFGLRMAEEVASWAEARGEDVGCRVGVHSGECVGGTLAARRIQGSGGRRRERLSRHRGPRHAALPPVRGPDDGAGGPGVHCARGAGPGELRLQGGRAEGAEGAEAGQPRRASPRLPGAHRALADHLQGGRPQLPRGRRPHLPGVRRPGAVRCGRRQPGAARPGAARR
ncbi:unnamed protein product, partial [Prorocentrum cordatum]